MSNRCIQCGHPESFPTLAEIWTSPKKPEASARVYEALLRSSDMTLEDLRKVAWPNQERRKLIAKETISILLKRLNHRLSKHGIAIARTGFAYEERCYRLVAL